jgi:diguanylate cyclase (GGDEF)-like protein
VRNKGFVGWVLCLLMLTVALPLWRHFGMNTSLRVDGAGRYPVAVYDDRELGGASEASVAVADHAFVITCRIRLGYAWPYCNVSITLGTVPHGVSLSRFDSVKLDIQAHGPAPMPVTVYLRNFDPAYYQPGSSDTLKVNMLEYAPANGEEPFTTPLANFHVATWWIQQFRVPAEYARPDLRNVVAIDIGTGGNVAPGLYTIGVRSIVFYGKWISEVELLTLLVALWSLTAMVSLVAGFREARRAAVVASSGRRELERINAALERERQALSVVANQDPLTRLYNRAGLRNRLALLRAEVDAQQRSLSVIFMDVDHFKKINDAHGHEAGDECLRGLARLVNANVREQDVLCRWGGEEFVLACDGATLEVAAARAERLRVAIEQAEWPRGIGVTCSFGVAQMVPGENLRELLKRADDALYAAKRAGRNAVRVAVARH